MEGVHLLEPGKGHQQGGGTGKWAEHGHDRGPISCMRAAWFGAKGSEAINVGGEAQKLRLTW